MTQKEFDYNIETPIRNAYSGYPVEQLILSAIENAIYLTIVYPDFAREYYSKIVEQKFEMGRQLTN